MKKMLYYDGIFHSGVTEQDTFAAMEVTDGKITAVYDCVPKDYRGKRVSLGGQHVYPCLIDGHTHLLFTIAVMAKGFNVCEITSEGVLPNTLAGVEARVRDYAKQQKKGAVIAANNYILSAVEERRLPTRFELDDWAEGRPIVIYNIDGHCSALSTAMLEKLGIAPEGHDGILSGEAHERNQGKLTDIIGESVSAADLARGIARFQNACAEYGISVVGALEGNGDSPEDKMTDLVVTLARRFDVGVRFYFQYMDLKKAQRFAKYQKHLRVGGCGDWEMDGASGAHSAAFYAPYKDTGEIAPCYYTQEQVDAAVLEADGKGYQIACHAIGDAAIDRIIAALNQTESDTFHRIEHCEFHTDEAFEELKKGRYAVMMQPGYAWIDKRYLHTYTQFLPDDVIARMKFKSLYDAGICVCGSSDSPVQDLDPYMQMQGMMDFYNDGESVSAYEAFRCYTIHPARALLEEGERGTLEVGKTADFFTADRNLFELTAREVLEFRPTQTYYGGRSYVRKTGSLWELAKMMLRKPKHV